MRPAADLLALDGPAQELLFTSARTANTFSAEPVSDDQLRAITGLAKWPQTMANTNPLRILFLRTPEGKDRLGPLMSEGNRAKTVSAPAVAVLAVDTDFHDKTTSSTPNGPLRLAGEPATALHTEIPGDEPRHQSARGVGMPATPYLAG